MPIAIDDFEKKPGEVLDIGEETNAYRIVKFLAVNNDKAFSPSEIADSTEVKEGSIGAVLSRLEDKGLVRHKGRYWAISEDDRIASFTAMTEASSASVNDDYFGEDE